MKYTPVSYRCDDGAEVFTFMRIDWDTPLLKNEPPDYELCLEDAYSNPEYCGIKGRFRRAWNAFKAKPIAYNGIFTSNAEAIKRFFYECIALIDKDALKPMKSGWLEAEDGDGAVCPHCGADFCVLVYETDDFIFCPHCGQRVIEVTD